MRIVILLVIGLVGFGAGWLAREATFKESPGRSERRTAERRALPPAAEEPPAPEPERLRTQRARVGAPYRGPDELAETEAEELAAAEPDGAGDAEKAQDPIEKWVRAQGSQWKAWAAMQAGQKIDALLRELGFDEATAELIKEKIQAEAEVQTEKFLQAMLGEAELDPDAIGYMMGLPETFSADLERELATFLRDEDIVVLRDGVKKAHDRQMRDMADMQINMMGIGDLQQAQREQLREVFTSRNMVTEQMSQFAEVTRNRERLSDLLKGGEEFEAAMEKNFAPTRERVQRILTPQQFERYRAYEKTMAQQARMGLKMMAAMMEQSGTQAPAGK